MGHHHDDYDPLIPMIRVVMIMRPMITRLTLRQGLVHLSNLLASPRVDLKYIIEADTKRWVGVRDQWSLSASVRFLQPKDLDQGLQDQSVQAVLVVTPTPTHKAIVLQSLAAGKDVFCEKPLAETSEGIRQNHFHHQIITEFLASLKALCVHILESSN